MSNKGHKNAIYRLRYFLTYGPVSAYGLTTTPLERFGYPVLLEDLRLSDSALQFCRTHIQRLQDEVTRESLGYGIPHDEQLDVDAKAFLIILHRTWH
ncbi:MAG: hypothetical protein HT580_00440 [Dechloromonas sp.]|nr:MAG: hypothetical protein HT580_00440 [Dechloromonas sp.]